MFCEDGDTAAPRAVVKGSLEEPGAEGEATEEDSIIGVNSIVGC